MKDFYTKQQWHTGRELSHQPALWQETFNAVKNAREELSKFLQNAYRQPGIQIILTGAGSSAFIGEILQYAFQKYTGLCVHAVPTTDLVTHPETFFPSSTPTLLVSFARSGDSPESLATVQLAEKLSDRIAHLIITCNPHGRLVEIARNARNAMVFFLPPEANDQALAMTSSFTSMTLAGRLIADLNNLAWNDAVVQRLSAIADRLLINYAPQLEFVTDLDIQRMVFLGSGPLKGAARESHLKVIELTDGQVNCQYESFLGFRHGPKAVIDDHTVLVYLFSNDPYVRKYELDLVEAIGRTEQFLYTIGIGQQLNGPEFSALNLLIDLSLDETALSDDILAICSVIPAQLMGFYRSIRLGLNPDSPSNHGGIHRVVQGVNIYPYND
jgi:tagatose-6-phosphate ketose/aldose isomerase